MQMRDSFALGMFANILHSPEGQMRRPPIPRETPIHSAVASPIEAPMPCTAGAPHAKLHHFIFSRELINVTEMHTFFCGYRKSLWYPS